MVSLGSKEQHQVLFLKFVKYSYSVTYLLSQTLTTALQNIPTTGLITSDQILTRSGGLNNPDTRVVGHQGQCSRPCVTNDSLGRTCSVSQGADMHPALLQDKVQSKKVSGSPSFSFCFFFLLFPFHYHTSDKHPHSTWIHSIYLQ